MDSEAGYRVYSSDEFLGAERDLLEPRGYRLGPEGIPPEAPEGMRPPGAGQPPVGRRHRRRPLLLGLAVGAVLALAEHLHAPAGPTAGPVASRPSITPEHPRPSRAGARHLPGVRATARGSGLSPRSHRSPARRAARAVKTANAAPGPRLHRVPGSAARAVRAANVAPGPRPDVATADGGGRRTSPREFGFER